MITIIIYQQHNMVGSFVYISINPFSKIHFCDPLPIPRARTVFSTTRLCGYYWSKREENTKTLIF